LLSLTDFDFELPPELIAQTPPASRGASRLLHLDAASRLHDRQFIDLPRLLNPNDLLVFNDTRVIKARLTGQKSTGGKVEVLVERVVAHDRVWAHVRASKSPGPGTRLRLADAFDATVMGRQGELFDLQFPSDALALLEAHGATPLPPYITHAPSSDDDDRYQTVYAQAPGAVAAPTAGLHFDQAMLQRLADAGIQHAFVTLHVGAGTFQPVRTDNLADHVMHAERYTVPPATQAAIVDTRARGGRVIAVGTTSMRALESSVRPDLDAPATGPTPTLPAPVSRTAPPAFHHPQGDTRLFIAPGYRIALVDALVTNFHLPQSTLLMLVSALAGTLPIKQAYAHAIAARYRFFSYGDAMFIESPKT